MLFSHEFLIVPESPLPLLGTDKLSKVASVFMNMEPSLSPSLIEQNVNPRMWADGKCYSCSCQAQIPALIPHKKQYPLKPKVKEWTKSYSTDFS